MNAKPLICCLLIASLMTACSSSRRSAIGPTIGPAVAKQEPENLGADEPLPAITLDELEGYYKEAFAVARDQSTRRDILMRLAGIEMQRSENRMVDSEKDGQFFGEAIKLYQELLTMEKAENVTLEEKAALEKRIDELLYQLSKAQALDGIENPSYANLEALAEQYPNSNFAAEADFRRAEKAFNEKRYRESETLYRKVIDRGVETPFYQNAIYMLGWSQFKQSQYEEAVETFTQILDNLYGDDDALKNLSNIQQNLADDTLRVVSLSFSYLDGPQSITDIYNRLGVRIYHHKLFERLGEQYLSQERYQDSAQVYLHYVAQNPLSDYAPDFSVKAISVYERGEFPSLIIPAKEDYVTRYGRQSDFWAQKPQVHDKLKSHLLVYLPELAAYEHANAQALVADKKVEQAQPVFLKAAAWYKDFIETFPDHEKTASLHFLMAEALESAGEIELAYEAFVVVAYDYQDKPQVENPNGANAAYAAILLANELATRGDEQRWLTLKIDNALKFAEFYPGDNRAAAVLVDAAQGMLATERQPEAINIASKVVALQPPPEVGLRLRAWLVLGQSEFDLQQYGPAERAYGEAVALMSLDDPKRENIIERLALSRYKRGEQLIAEGKKDEGIQLLLGVRDVAPNSEIAITAEFDAGDTYMKSEQWAQAATIFEAFKVRYPNHELAQNMPAKLALIYQKTEQWGKAASELAVMSNSNDPELARQSLLLSAQLYQKSGDLGQAIDNYRDYANRYEQPKADLLEAQFQLVELYDQTQDPSKRDFWLGKIVNQPIDANMDTRSRFIVAGARSWQAEKSYQRFQSIKLTLPLKNSIAKKKQAFNEALSAYQTVVDLGVAEYVTEANYFMGELYHNFAKSIMQSSRPRNLDELALEEYEIILEEQAYPLEEKAMELHEANAARISSNIYDAWVAKSFDALAELSPGRYDKKEQSVGVSRGIH